MATHVKTANAASEAEIEARANELHQTAVVVDGQTTRETDPPSLTGGVTARVITLAGSEFRHDTTFAMREVSSKLDFIDFYHDRLLLVRTANDIERAKREGKLGLIFEFQGIGPIANDLSLVRIFYELGLRIMQPTYMEHTLAGSGCLEPNDLGLTSFGRQLIRAMERTGILLDLSHVGRRTSLDALALARKPVVFSHSNPAALHECPRNVTDEMIKACAATGGVVGVTPCCVFIAPKGAPRPTISDMVTHIAHVADLVGIDHVGVCHDTAPDISASVFQAATYFGRNFKDELDSGRTRAEKDVVGFETKADFPKLTFELVRRGFSNEEIYKILGGNWMRVYRTAWVPEPARVALS